jgi:hypothetical protein
MELNRLMAEAVRFRKEIGALLESLDPTELEQGLLVVKASLLSGTLKPFILSQAGSMLEDYSIRFENGQIQLRAVVDVKQLGPLEVDYKITISEFRFGEMGHKLYGTFSETANPLGNMVQKLAFKAALLNGPLLKTAVKMGNVSFVQVDGNNLMIDFDGMEFIERLPENLVLDYVSAKDGKLSLMIRG